MSTNLNIPELLAQGLNEDVHWFPESVGISELAVVLAAMANSFGGLVILGVSPRGGQVQGVRDVEKVRDTIFQAALLIAPVLVLPLPQLEEVRGETVIVVMIPPGLPNVYSYEGRHVKRVGHQVEVIPSRELRRMMVERGIVQFESRIPTGVTLDDLDTDQIEAYIELLNLPGSVDWKEMLKQRGCLILEAGELQPTYAAILLFGRNPQRWLPNASMLAARFPGVSFTDEFIKQDISDSLPEQLRQAESFLRSNLSTVVRMIGLEHQETLEYPFEAVRELLVNAVAHRDYNMQGDNIHLHLFTDRLEVHSPGSLPGPVTIDNLLQARFSRNAVIVQVLSDMGFVERLGYGLNRVVRAVRQNGLPAPRFEEVGGSFRVTLYGQKFPLDALPDLSEYAEMALNERQELALSYLASNSRITSSTYQELCPDVSPETLRRDFADLVKRGVLLKMGTKRSTYYILKEKKK